MRTTLWIDVQHRLLRRLDSLNRRPKQGAPLAPHLALGLYGEREALFELRRLGYVVVARRWTSSKLRGDIDLVAWEGDWLCFIEVKTRSGRSSMAPAEMAVDREKQQVLRRMAQAYLHHFPEHKRRHIPTRFDVVAVYENGQRWEFELFRSAFRWR